MTGEYMLSDEVVMQSNEQEQLLQQSQAGFDAYYDALGASLVNFVERLGIQPAPGAAGPQRARLNLENAPVRRGFSWVMVPFHGGALSSALVASVGKVGRAGSRHAGRAVRFRCSPVSA